MRRLLFPLAFVMLAGCAQRKLDITSEPSGALVYLNGEEVGRTPMRYDFMWHGDYDIVLRRNGYQTLKTHRKLNAPLLFVPPLDLVGEMIGARDHRKWHFEMQQPGVAASEPAELIARGRELKKELRSSEYTHPPTTLPVAQPRTTETAPATRAGTRE
jgi:hypothetical protein